MDDIFPVVQPLENLLFQDLSSMSYFSQLYFWVSENKQFLIALGPYFVGICAIITIYVNFLINKINRNHDRKMKELELTLQKLEILYGHIDKVRNWLVDFSESIGTELKYPDYQFVYDAQIIWSLYFPYILREPKKLEQLVHNCTSSHIGVVKLLQSRDSLPKYKGKINVTDAELSIKYFDDLAKLSETLEPEYFRHYRNSKSALLIEMHVLQQEIVRYSMELRRKPTSFLRTILNLLKTLKFVLFIKYVNPSRSK